VINRQGFKQEDCLKGFEVVNQQYPPKDEVSSSGVDDSHSENGGEGERRKNAKKATWFKFMLGSVIIKRNHHNEDAMVGCKIMNRCIDSEHTVASSDAQSNNNTTE
jgi:hypothetical protein